MRNSSFLRATLGIAIVLSTVLVAPPAAAGTLQDLIDSADDGSVVQVGPGTYDGPIVIDKPITIEGVGRPVIDGGGEGTVVLIASPDVTIRGFEVRGSGESLNLEDTGIRVEAIRATVIDNMLNDVLFGIYLMRSIDSVIVDNVISAKPLGPARRGDPIRLWESDGTLVKGNRVTQGRDILVWYSDNVTFQDNTISEGRYGLHLMFSDDVTARNNRLTDNSVGAFIMYSSRFAFVDNVLEGNNGPSGYGVGLKDMDEIEMTGNRFIGNRVGLYIDNSPSKVKVEHQIRRNLFAYNDIGILLLPSVSRNLFVDNAFIDNRQQVGVSGSGSPSDNEWSEAGTGNYWSDYTGYDADGDGIGDVPQRVDDLFSSLANDTPELAIFSGTPAARMIDAAAKAFPTLRPAPIAVDRAPLINPPVFTGAQPIGTSGLVAMVGVLLLASAAGILALGRIKTEPTT